MVARAKENVVRVVFTATPDAPGWYGEISLEASARIGADPVTRTVRSGVIVHGAGDTNISRVRTRLETGLPLAVSGHEKAPAALEVEGDRRFSVTLGETLEIPIRVPVREEPKGNLVVTPVGLRGLTRPPTVNIAEKDGKATLKLKFAEQRNVFAPEAGTWNFVLRGTGTTKYRRRPEAAKRAEEERDHVAKLAQQYTEAATAAKQAIEAKRKELETARKDLAAASPDAKPPLEATVKKAEAALQQAEQSASAAEEKRAAAEKEKAAAAKRAEDAKKAAAAKDTSFAAWSLPITVEVKPAPEKK